ncbi:MAG TPA: hypothetical protein VM734_09305 [Kofleriaceae bacterium]|jgi:hypothetical protein|nr:hypothetical protein [Kofleriaceae bacterium]
MRALATSMLVMTACRLGEHVAEPPIDGGDGTVDGDPGAGDAAIDAPDGPRGLLATIGDRPEFTGGCGALDDRAEMLGRFDTPAQEQVVRAGWEFDTDADSYGDPSYGFDPPWPSAPSERFSVRFHGRILLPAGTHCFSIDIGATGTDIIGGKNACGQLWLAGAAAPSAETGFEAATAGVATGCIDVAGGATDLDIVFWYFNIFERAKLRVRQCAGAACTPDQPLDVETLLPP